MKVTVILFVIVLIGNSIGAIAAKSLTSTEHFSGYQKKIQANIDHAVQEDIPNIKDITENTKQSSYYIVVLAAFIIIFFGCIVTTSDNADKDSGVNNIPAARFNALFSLLTGKVKAEFGEIEDGVFHSKKVLSPRVKTANNCFQTTSRSHGMTLRSPRMVGKPADILFSENCQQRTLPIIKLFAIFKFSFELLLVYATFHFGFAFSGATNKFPAKAESSVPLLSSQPQHIDLHVESDFTPYAL